MDADMKSSERSVAGGSGSAPRSLIMGLGDTYARSDSRHLRGAPASVATRPISAAGGGPGGHAHITSLIWTLIRTDFKVRYHGTLGGFVWALLKPVSMFLVLLAVFSFIFAPTDPNYRSNLILGLFLWEFFSEGTKMGLVSLFAKGYLLTKTRFPRWIVVATSTSNAVITLLVCTIAILLYLAWAGRFPTPSRLLLFIVYEIEMWMIVLGFSLSTSVLYPRYRDLNHLWDAISQAGFFVAPIVFPIHILPESLHPYLYLWPPTPVIEFARRVLIHETIPSLEANLLLLVAALSILAVGIVVFQRHAPRVAEHL
jgi:ABC-type polysaccharide/polyol phosphate export permease